MLAMQTPDIAPTALLPLRSPLPALRAAFLTATALATLTACPGVGGQSPPPAAPLPDTTAAVLGEGTAAPAASALGPKDKPVSIADFRGKILVLYFYPTDFATGATAEAEEFRDDYAKYKKLGAAIVGVSTDDQHSHADFIKRYRIPFPLLSDPNTELASAFRVPIEAGTARHVTFVIDRDGVIRKVWRKVRAWGHSAEVLAAVKSLGGR